MTREELDSLGSRVLDAAYRVHTALGPGLLESAYVACLVYELRSSGMEVKTEVPIPLVYGGKEIGGCRLSN
jgi:GxxExxY protein